VPNLDETPGVTLEGLGFTGSDVRRSFEMAARTRPVDMLYFDYAGDPAPDDPVWRCPNLTMMQSCASDRQFGSAPKSQRERQIAQW
jgi:hypothetical protein